MAAVWHRAAPHGASQQRNATHPVWTLSTYSMCLIGAVLTRRNATISVWTNLYALPWTSYTVVQPIPSSSWTPVCIWFWYIVDYCWVWFGDCVILRRSRGSEESTKREYGHHRHATNQVWAKNDHTLALSYQVPW